jgi:hypothetical protein
LKKVTLLMLILIIVLSLSMSSYAKAFFYDVPENEWYYSYIEDLAEKGIFSGFSDGTFRPNEKVTVGQFLKLIMVASLKIEPVSSISLEHWAVPYLTLAEEYNVIEEGYYYPSDLDSNISRIEIVQILSKCDLFILKNQQMGGNIEFNDTQTLSVEETMYLNHAVGIGAINGDPEGTFRPDDYLSRSECAKIIYTFINR